MSILLGAGLLLIPVVKALYTDDLQHAIWPEAIELPAIDAVASKQPDERTENPYNFPFTDYVERHRSATPHTWFKNPQLGAPATQNPGTLGAPEFLRHFTNQNQWRQFVNEQAGERYDQVMDTQLRDLDYGVPLRWGTPLTL